MPALWDNKVTFVSVSQFLGLALHFPFLSVSGPFVTLRIFSHLGKEKKREDPKRKK